MDELLSQWRAATDREAFLAMLERIPLKRRERCPLCQNDLGRLHHALYLAILEKAEIDAEVSDDASLQSATIVRLALPGPQLHKRIFKGLVGRRWGEDGN